MLAIGGIAPATFAATSDNGHGAQAVCRYGEIDPADTNGNTGMRIKRVDVLPPTLYGHYPGQTVGWRFVVQRWYSDLSTFAGPWKRIYASSIQSSVAYPDQAGVFSAMSARIRFVHGIDRWPYGYSTVFRAIAAFYWYDDQGGIETWERFTMGVYPVYRNGIYQFTSYGQCEGAWLDG
jgi:hypothetical protein